MFKYVLTAEYISLQNGKVYEENTWEFRYFDELAEEINDKRLYWSYLDTVRKNTYAVPLLQNFNSAERVVLVCTFTGYDGVDECMTIFRVKRVYSKAE